MGNNFRGVLLIDDDVLINKIHKHLLVKVIETPIMAFAHAEAALNFLMKEEGTFFILLDLNMPLISGWDFLRILKKRIPGFQHKILILSSSIDTSDKLKALAYPEIHAYIEKPLTSSGLNFIKELYKAG